MVCVSVDAKAVIVVCGGRGGREGGQVAEGVGCRAHPVAVGLIHESGNQDASNGGVVERIGGGVVVVRFGPTATQAFESAMAKHVAMVVGVGGAMLNNERAVVADANRCPGTSLSVRN